MHLIITKKYVTTEKLIKEDKIQHKLAAIEVNNQIIQIQSERKALKDKNLALAEKNEIINAERKKSDTLLLNILPEKIAIELKENGKVKAKFYDSVSILFTDFSGFTSIAESLSPEVLVEEIDDCFKEFDKIITKHGIEKIKTIGDAYMAVCGLPEICTDHAKKIILAALEVRDYLLNRKSKNNVNFKMRIGIHSGSVVAGVVGIKKFVYDIWGDAVNAASRMESTGEIGKVNVSQSTYALVKEDFNFEYRGKLTAKGKGELEMYFVEPK
jgi:adenylate cyclase